MVNSGDKHTRTDHAKVAKMNLIDVENSYIIIDNDVLACMDIAAIVADEAWENIRIFTYTSKKLTYSGLLGLCVKNIYRLQLLATFHGMKFQCVNLRVIKTKWKSKVFLFKFCHNLFYNLS